MNGFIHNRYRIIKEIGRGGMGIVYLVNDVLKDNAVFALKTIKEEILSLSDTYGIQTFKNEYEIMTKLKHPNLVQVFDLGNDENNYYIVMDYIQGELIRDIIKDEGSLLFDEVLDIIIQILRALEFIHSRDIIYKDLKPANIMIASDGLKLLDFGISDFLKVSAERVQGTVLYMAPELFIDRENADYRCDIFSLGILFFELISKIRFYKDKNLNSILNILVNKNNFKAYAEEKMSILNSDHYKLIKKMLAYDKEERYGSCSEIIKDINSRFCRDFDYETGETKKSYVLGCSFVNRKKEISCLRSKIADKSIMTVYRGPTGIGKTRLFKELERYCKINDMVFIGINCIEGSSNFYYSVGEILKQLIFLSKENLLRKYAPFLKLILHDMHFLEEYDGLEINDPALMKNIILHNISDYIADFAKNAKEMIIIYIDDLQYLDIGSSMILKELQKKVDGRKLKIFASFNNEKIVSNDLIENTRTEVLSLRPFNSIDVKEYLNNIFGRKFIHKSILSASGDIESFVGGNVLFLEELIKSLLLKGIIIKDGRYWRLARPMENIDIPKSLNKIVQEKIERLFESNDIRVFLQSIALLRIDLSFEQLKIILNNMDIMKIFSELERQEILNYKRIDNKAYIKINNTMIRDIIRDTIENGAEIHSFLALSLESLQDEYDEEIAYHYIESNEAGKAVPFLLRSAKKAKDNYFNENAIYYYDLALKYAGQKETVGIIFDKALVLTVLSRWNEALDILDECISLAKGKRRVLINNLYGNILSKQGNYKEALNYYDRSLNILKGLDNKKLYCNTIAHIAYIHFLQGKFDDAMKSFELSRDIAFEIDDKIEIQSIIGDMGNLYLYIGDNQKAMECYQKKKEISEMLGDKLNISSAFHNMGLILLRSQEYDKAMKYFSMDKETCRKIGDKQGYAIAVGHIGLIEMDRGNLKKAVNCFNTKRKICKEIGDSRGMGYAIGCIGMAYFKMEEYNKGLYQFNKSIEILDKIGEKYGKGISASYIGRIYAKRENYEKALEYIDSSINICEELNLSYDLIEKLIWRSEILLLKNDYEQGEKTINRAISISSDLGEKEFLEKALEIKNMIITAKNSLLEQ